MKIMLLAAGGSGGIIFIELTLDVLHLLELID